jgi:peptidyl-prolyl cis-trans isomerase B (cyclophilin B)
MLRLVTWFCLAAALGALLVACGEDDASRPQGGSAQEKGTPAPAPTSEAGCETVRAPEPKADGELSKPKLRLDRTRTYLATVKTSCGDFEITLDAKRSPRTGGSFVSLARDRFFDGGIFHRIVPDFVIQGGDPTGTGMGGPGYSITEAPPDDLSYTKGVVAMAKTEAEAPGTSGSQFYVVTGDDAGLPPDYALLGQVTKGIEVVELIGAVPAGADGRPVDPVIIRSVTVKEG